MLEPLANIFNAMRSEQVFERIQKAFAEEQRRERGEAERHKNKDRDQQNFELIVEVTENQRQIAELEERMARNYEILQKKYGDDVIGGMATTWLTKEETAGLRTDDERLQALSEKFLNEDGSIKPRYEDLVDAHYVRDWSAVTKLKLDKSAEPAPAVADRQPETEDSALNSVSKPLF